MTLNDPISASGESRRAGRQKTNCDVRFRPCNPDWPERPVGTDGRKFISERHGLVTVQQVCVSRIDWRPYLNPERARGNKERRSPAGL
jgi:hypothetical protein